MLRTTAKSNPKKALSSANMLSRTLKNERQDQMDYALLLLQKKINHISSSFVLLGLLDDYWGQRAFVDRESRVGREDNSMTVGIVCQDDRQAYQLIHSHIYPILFGLSQSTLDTFCLCHIFLCQIYWLALTFLLWGKALLTYISTYLHIYISSQIAVRSKVNTFRYYDPNCSMPYYGRSMSYIY